MSFENPNQNENISISEITIESGFENLVPEEFKADPFTYFEKYGHNIKSGEIKYDLDSTVKEDPTAVKDLPTWQNQNGEKLDVVGKKVNTTKSQVRKSADPFYEYYVMNIAKEFNLPAPKPVAKIKRGDEHLIIMEKIEGIRWTEEGMRLIQNSGLTENDKQSLLAQAQNLMNILQEKYEQIGLHRNWKLKDMIFDVDIPNKKVLGVTPTDWERTKINMDKLTKARQDK